MTPSEELELKIYRFAEFVGKARWRVASLPLLSSAFQFPEEGVLIDALHDLHARKFLELRQWDYGRNDWVFYKGLDPGYFNRDFQIRVTFSGRKYFESIEGRAAEEGRSVSPRTQERTDSNTASHANQNPSSVSIPASQSKQPKVFVSHSTQDRSFVERFAADLRTKGVDAWYSGWEIKPGDSIRAKIEEGLEGCEYFIIVLSKNSITRPWVQTELDAATVGKISGKVRKIIPVKIEDCGNLPPTLGSLCWEDFSSQPYDLALKRVLDSIFEVDVRPPLGAVPTATAPNVGKPPIVVRPEQTRKRPATKFPIYMDDLGTFANNLRSEGFDAHTDLFNGQVGLIVGPKGLDPIRMPPDTAGLFFPLWELNHEANRSLVAARKFHEIFESRSQDWQFNRPYQQSREQERMNMRYWSRSASLLGDKKLEGSILQELVRRFPESEYPVNIDVVGGQHQTYAVVHIYDFDVGIDEKAKAMPEDFLGSGGMMAAVVAAAKRVILELQEAGRIPTARQREPENRMKITLTLHELSRSRTGSVMGTGPVIQYRVGGMPPGEEASIANRGSRHHESWQILRVKDGVQGHWTGNYKSAEDALADLQKEFDHAQ